MKNLNNALLFLLLSVLVVSCGESFLDLSPQQAVSDQEALTNINDYESSVTGIYNDLQSPDYYGRYFFVIPDVMADDVKQNSQANRAKDYAEHEANVADRDARAMWTLMYRAINAANAIINADITVPASVKAQQDHIVGEAKALRGLIYFDLVRLYAQHYTFTGDAGHPGVPLVLAFDPENKPARNTVKQVYDQIISDMTEGIALMKETSRTGNSNTLSALSAKALLARVYQYKDDWSNAEKLATEVINSGKYSLESNASYANLWLLDNRPEHIFSVSMTEADNPSSNALGNMYLARGFGDYLPSNDVVGLYPTGDARLQVFKVDPLLSGNYAPYRMEKYADTRGWDDIKVIRLAELFLIRAEARAAIGTNIQGAQADLDRIKQRGLPSAAPTSATGEALKTAIRTERRLELCFEGQRLWDLMRYKQDIVRNQCTANICTIKYGSDTVVLPIPQYELDANPNMEPNPGYN